MKKQELNNQIKAIQEEASLKITLLKKEYEISQKTPNVQCSVFENFILFECKTKAHLKEVLTAFPAGDTNERNPLYGYENIPYNFQYHIGIDNNINDIAGRINYPNIHIGDVLIKFNPSVIEGYLCEITRKVYDTELHYFEGVSKQEIGKIKIRALSFGEKAARYYGGNEKLKCAKTARELIALFTG